MKKIVPLSVLSAALVFASVSLLNGKDFFAAKAYSVSSLATTIDLNDCTSDDIRNYYSSINSLSDAEAKGTNLLKNLKTILKNGQKYYSYDSGSLWAMYEISDRDWKKSPASALPSSYGYNASTNIIASYKYGSSGTKKGSDPYVHSLYTNRDVDNQAKAWGDHTQTNWGINQEHVWPKSQGFEAEGAGGARGDPMHLLSGNGYANNAHSQYFYGYVDKTKTYTNCGSTYSYLAGNLVGTSKTIGNGTVFEPQDSDKGDIARCIFYMVARYNYYSGSDSDGIDQNNPNLVLVEDSHYSAKYTSTKTNPGKMGIISDLLAWNKLDPVDEFEIHRNNLLFKNYTNNRNPFIDFPQWADIIWGTETGRATPSSDVINDSALILEEVNSQSGTFKAGDKKTLKATTEDASPITWSIEDNTIATLDKTSTASGESVVVTAVKDGETRVIATATVDGKQQSKSFRIVVGEKKSSGGGDSTPQGGDNNEQVEMDWKAFFEANKTWIIVGGIGLAVLLIVVIILFAAFGSKKAKKKVNKAIKKTVKKSVKSGSKKKK